MPTDTPTDEREMAREAMHLMLRGRDWTEAEGPAMFGTANRASDILSIHGHCPGFWGEVLAAVRLLSNKPGLHTVWDYRGQWRVGDTKQRRISADDARVTTIHLTDGYSTEPAAILAALRAVVEVA